jgi:hypothetical protein
MGAVQPFGFSLGWYFKDDKGEYCIVFGNCKTREHANEVLKREKPDVELVNLDYEPPTYSNKKPMDHYLNKK